MEARKKIFWITTFIIVTAIIIVICVSYFTGNKASEFDGTLVETTLEFPSLI